MADCSALMISVHWVVKRAEQTYLVAMKAKHSAKVKMAVMARLNEKGGLKAGQ